MPRRKNKNSGLGNAIRNKQGRKNNPNRASGRVKRREKTMNELTTTVETKPALKSVTEVSNLQEFVDTKLEVQRYKELEEEVKLIVKADDLIDEEQRLHDELEQSQIYDYTNLPIPRRPAWTKETTPEELEYMEQKIFLEWRRNLAHTSKHGDNVNKTMTPYEKNLEIWRQLWRVVERSHLIVFIVDARNPLAYISRDLFKYVKEVDENKQVLLLINKADYLTPLQRSLWSKYFQSKNIAYLYFSAIHEQIKHQHLLSKSRRDQLDEKRYHDTIQNVNDLTSQQPVDDSADTAQTDAKEEDASDNKRSNLPIDIKQTKFYKDTHVMNTEELIEHFRSYIQKNPFLKEDNHIVVGMVGYPNVGKSSIINVLLGAKKVGVAPTPGKTKHFATLVLEKDITLCDCPGLVFPTLMSSKAELVLNGVLSVDTLTDCISPARLMVHRVSLDQFNDRYHLNIVPRRSHFVTVYDVLDRYCQVKHWFGKTEVPLRSQAAKLMLKDYVKGKLLYVQPPPNLDESERYAFYHGSLVASAIDPIDSGHDTFTDSSNLQSASATSESQSMAQDSTEEAPQEEDTVGVETTEEMKDSVYDMTDEEFMELWKHPLDNYSKGRMGTSKRKHEKKARVARRIEKRKAKGDRKYRHDSDNFATGSNMISTSSVPFVRTTYEPVRM